MIGKVFGNRYELLEKVGTGGMAIVYKARCHLLNRFVAVKVLKEEYVTDQEFLTKFSKEAQAAASLSHHNIVNVYDVGNEDGNPYIVMEYVPNKTLKDYIDGYDGFLKNEEIADFAKQIALALEHAHSNQIIHRDIKPHNILVAQDGTLKVADFGIASAISETTTSYSSEAIGSVKYTSPEQARGKHVDERTDLYSLGVLMYEMATCSVPFQGETAVEIALKHMNEDIKDPSSINTTFHKGLESIVKRSLLKDIGQRYQTARELIGDLDKIINNPTVNVAFYDFDTDAPTQKIPSLEAYDVKGEGEKRTMKQTTKQSTKKPKKKLVIPNANLLKAIGVVLLAFITVLVVFVFTRLGDAPEVQPDFVILADVVNTDYDAAKAKLELEGYVVIQGIVEKNNDIPEGFVSSQNPIAGTKLRPGYKITLNTSEGADKAVVPNLEFKTLSEAQVIIENTDFTIGEIDYINNDIDQGFILSQDPEAGTDIRNDAVINLIVSLGPEHNQVSVPRLTDMEIEEAKKLIIDLGLEVGEMVYENHLSIEKDKIITQSIAEGTEVDFDTLIDLTISLGKEEEEEEEESDPNAVKTLAYNIPTSDYANETITLKVTYEKSGVTSTVYNQSHKIEADTNAVLIEVTGSGKGYLNFFINDQLVTSINVDFSK